jgi:hypothetical protein
VALHESLTEEVCGPWIGWFAVARCTINQLLDVADREEVGRDGGVRAQLFQGQQAADVTA